MNFIEYKKDFCTQLVFSWFANRNKLSNEEILEKTIVTENEEDMYSLNKYIERKITLEQAKFKVNITAFNILDEFVVLKYLERDPKDGSQSITETGKAEMKKYKGVELFEELNKVSDLKTFVSEDMDWKRYSNDLIRVLNLNNKEYERK